MDPRDKGAIPLVRVEGDISEVRADQRNLEKIVADWRIDTRERFAFVEDRVVKLEHALVDIKVAVSALGSTLSHMDATVGRWSKAFMSVFCVIAAAAIIAAAKVVAGRSS